MQRPTFALTLALAGHMAQAAIVETGTWTGKDFYDAANKTGVANGIPYSNDAVVQHRLRSPLSKDTDMVDYLQMANVARVVGLLPESEWDVVFPSANAVYTYENFLKAVGKFPAFCNETNLAGQSLDDTCKRELSNLFAHWGQETGARSGAESTWWTQALFYVQEINKSDYKSSNWSATAWPPQAGVQYYGRGPMQLSWNYNYGQFSNIFIEGRYDSKMALLQNPDQVHTDGFTAFAAGLWFYMTPQSPKPSMHDVMTGYFAPNAADTTNNVGADFATTINIINGGLECGNGFGYDKVVRRGQYYLEWLNYFGLPAEGNLDCGNQPKSLNYGGASTVNMYWEKDSANTGRCKVSQWQSLYSTAARDDYKRCVCDSWHAGNEAAQCATGSPDTSNIVFATDPVDPVDPPVDPVDPPVDPVDPPVDPVDPDVWQTFADLQAIRDNPHYSATSYSRTLYQIEGELDFFESKLEELFTVAINNGVL